MEQEVHVERDIRQGSAVELEVTSRRLQDLENAQKDLSEDKALLDRERTILSKNLGEETQGMTCGPT